MVEQKKVFDVIKHIVIFQNVILVHTLQIMYNITTNKDKKN